MTQDCFVLYGAGGHARVVAAIIRSLGWRVHGFYDDSFAGHEMIQGAPVLGTFAAIADARAVTAQAALALGNGQRRQEGFDILLGYGFRFPSLVHAKAHIEPDVRIDEGAVVCLGAMLGTQAAVGRGAIINTGAIVDHESSVGEFSHLAPGASVAGRTRVGDRVFVGMNACIADGLRVGNDAVIGAGSVVLSDVPSGARVLGVHHVARPQ